MKAQSKKRKILFGLGVSIAVLVFGGWLLFRFHLSWLSLEDNLPPGTVTYNEEDSSFHADYMGMYDMIFHTQEPMFYAGNVPVPVRDGARIRNGRPYISLRDVGIFNPAIDAITDTDTSAHVAVITNGLYGQGTEEQNEMIHSFLGGEYARDRFELYFQWYNTIHELGHLITFYHETAESRHTVDEEQLVNSFAVAFWMYYGEEEKLDALEDMVDYVLGNIIPPVDNMSHLDYWRGVVDEERIHEEFTFNNYGWFQFSIVRDLLRERNSLDLESILTEMMGVENVQLQPTQTLVYPRLGTDVAPEIIADVISLLRDWGVTLPDVYIAFPTDPNMHSLQYPVSRLLLERNIEAGRVIPVSR